MKNQLKSLLASALALIAVNANAAPVDAHAAQAVANQFLNTQANAKFMARGHAMSLAHVERSKVNPASADYYVFNGQDDGFVIVAGDDRAEPVLAYGEHPIDMTNVPCNLRWMLDHYKQEMEYLHAHPAQRVERREPSSLVVPPLMVSTWSQGAPYNYMCPVDHGQYCATGCVATAAAQVMYYWQFPEELPFLISYNCYSLGIILPDLPEWKVDWDNMLDGYYWDLYAPEHGNAVATLMRYCGQACYMGYGTDGSGAFCEDQLTALLMFEYNPAARLLKRERYSDEEWSQMIQEELSEGRPVLYSGYGEVGGHAFVLHGFDGSKYYINWGWEGVCDGYFALDAFIPSYGMEFTERQDMLRGIHPSGFGVPVHPYDFEADGIYYKQIEGGAKVVNSKETFNSYSGQVTIPATVTYNGTTMPVTAIGKSAFRNCTELTRVTLPSSVVSIGKYAFKNCTALTSVVIPNSVETIDYAAFDGCTSLTNVTLGSGMRELGYYAFARCPKLSHVTFPANLKRIGTCAFYSCTALTSVKLGDGTEVIDEYAFARCTKLTTVNFGNGLQTLGPESFSGCSHLESVTFGTEIEFIDTKAFAGCDALRKIKLYREDPPELAANDCFTETCYNEATLYVPEEYEEDYRYFWKKFHHFVGFDPFANPGDVNGDGEVNLGDINTVIDGILGDSTDSALDVNGDGEVNIADVNALIDMILSAD